MHSPIRIFLAAAIAGLMTAGVTVRTAQAPAKSASQASAIAAARTIMAAARYATLITLEGYAGSLTI